MAIIHRDRQEICPPYDAYSSSPIGYEIFQLLEFVTLNCAIMRTSKCVRVRIRTCDSNNEIGAFQ